MMAASRIGASRRLCAKYKYFFYAALCILGVQLLLAYNFYGIYQTDTGGIPVTNDGERIAKNPKSDSSDGKFEVASYASVSREVSNRNKENSQSFYIPKCTITSKETLSALQRARTTECKQEIADTACLDSEGKLYVTSLPRFCPLKGNDTGHYYGCYKDNRNSRDLGGVKTEFPDKNSPRHCMNHCLLAGFKFAGLQYGKECWCGDSFGQHGGQPEEICNSKCPDIATSEMCGGFLSNRVFSTGLGAKKKNAAVFDFSALPLGMKAVKIAFVLTFNGRALRQVLRFFRTIYHRDHYYYIHVDARQEYMYRELMFLEERFSNVRLARMRLATIWGGASLLQMLLHCMQDLLSIPGWDWDYFINLSESDYPIKYIKVREVKVCDTTSSCIAFCCKYPVHNDFGVSTASFIKWSMKPDMLVSYLTKNKGKNFLKSHGRDTPRFIKKQGLDKTFYECDNHMWRLGSRRIPEGIRLDGGSDWICLYRDYCHYIINSQDALLSGLKHFYKFTLLPAESFFHSLLHNSKFCESHVDNHLHLTNWRRKQGCKCQYKHIVDWCGCSPIDYKPSDLEKLMSMQNRPLFFARKFEAIVNQEIINDMDIFLFGHHSQGVPALKKYWQTEYHHLDVNTRTNDSYLTFYHSFIRTGIQDLRQGNAMCGFRPLKLLEVTILNDADHFHGILVLYSAELTSTGKVYEIETHLHQKDHYAVISPEGPIGRLQSLEMGTDFDVKEMIFRNYAQLIGPYSDLALRHVWGPGEQFTVTVAWIDPAMTVAACYDITVPTAFHIGSHKPEFNKPLRPGMWTLKLLYNWKIVAQTNFLITPLTFFEGRGITGEEIKSSHNGPPSLYSVKEFNEFRTLLKLDNGEKAEKQAVSNGQKVGHDLEAWVDSLASNYWQVQNSCIVNEHNPSCSQLDLCAMSTWSSRSPDPKSQITDIDLKTGHLT